MLTKSELAETLDVDESQVDEWIKTGLPGGPEFDPESVFHWLVTEGIASPDEAPPAETGIGRTRKDVAVFFGVNTRTVAGWLEDPSFPGKPGSAGKRNGHFPFDEISQWLVKNRKQAGGDSSLDDELKAEKIRAVRLKNEMATGSVVDAEATRRLFVRTNALANRVLYQLVAEIPLLLPPDTDSETVKEVRLKVRQKLDQVTALLSSSIREIGSEE